MVFSEMRADQNVDSKDSSSHDPERGVDGVSVSVGLGTFLLSNKYIDLLVALLAYPVVAMVFQTVGHVTHVSVTRYVYDPGGYSYSETERIKYLPL